MFILPFMRDHLPFKTTLRYGLYIEVPLYYVILGLQANQTKLVDHSFLEADNIEIANKR